MSTANSVDKDQAKESSNKNGQAKEDKFNQVGETKNIPKNYGKQIIKFVFENEGLVRRILASIDSEVDYE